MNETIINRAVISGKVMARPIFDHNDHEENFYYAEIGCKRGSGTIDTIPFLFSEKVIDPTELAFGDDVEIHGTFRSYNLHENGRSHLRLVVLASEILFLKCLKDQNEVELDGFVCKPVTLRKTTRTQTDIADLHVAVNFPYGDSVYIPCICWNTNALYASTELKVGSHVHVLGRIQSRNYYVKKPDGTFLEKTAFELSIYHMYREEKEDGKH